MTQEQKELLLKDICDRLPYEVKYNFGGYDATGLNIYKLCGK